MNTKNTTKKRPTGVEVRLTKAQKDRLNFVGKYKGITLSQQIRGLLDKHLQTEIGQISLLEQSEPQRVANTTGAKCKAVERLEIRFSDADKAELHKVAKRLDTTVSALLKTLIDTYLQLPEKNENEK